MHVGHVGLLVAQVGLLVGIYTVGTASNQRVPAPAGLLEPCGCHISDSTQSDLFGTCAPLLSRSLPSQFQKALRFVANEIQESREGSWLPG